jgi:hypothetical protein
MTIRWRGRELHVTRFGEDIYIIDDGKVVAGAVIGRMPTDPANEQWRLLAQVWARHVEE